MIGRGKYSAGMVVEIPATFFNSNNQPVEVENVVVDIQHFDNAHRKVIHLLGETAMPSVSKGMYLYRYQIPPQVDLGTYVVNIKAKYGASQVIEKSDTFDVIDGVTDIRRPENGDISMSMDNKKVEETYDPMKGFDIKTFRIDQVQQQVKQNKVEIEDLVVDVYNLPVQGVHVNVYEKTGFMPKSPNNVKVGSAITDEKGVWRMTIAPGDYVFTYKGINKKENREFRKV